MQPNGDGDKRECIVAVITTVLCGVCVWTVMAGIHEILYCY